MVTSIKTFSNSYLGEAGLDTQILYQKVTFEDDNGLKLDKKKFVEEFKQLINIRIFDESFIAYNNKTGISDIISDIELERIIKFIVDEINSRIWNLHLGSNIKEILKREVDTLCEIPKYEDYIFLENGIYEISTRQIIEYNPDIIVTKKIDNAYNEEATCPQFIRFIEESMCGDQELVAVIHEMLGYILIDSTKAQKFFLIYGLGSNGKSVLGDVIIEMLGKDNTSSVSLKQMNENFIIANIMDKKANVSAENEANFETEKLKAITSGDTITMDRKYKEAIEYKPTAKMIFISNILPNTMDNSHGFYRRLMIIPFNNIISEADKDVDLLSKLQKEKEGILMWSIEGLHRLIENNYVFSNSKMIENITKKYIEGQDTVLMFFKENIRYVEGGRLMRKEIIEKYKIWGAKNAIDTNGTESTAKFWKEFRRVAILEGLEFEESKFNGTRGFKNIGWAA